MKICKESSTKTISQSDLFLKATEISLNNLINSKGFTFNEEEADKFIQKVYTILVNSAKKIK